MCVSLSGDSVVQVLRRVCVCVWYECVCVTLATEESVCVCVTLWRLCCASLEEGVCVYMCVTLVTLLRGVCHSLATLLCEY